MIVTGSARVRRRGTRPPGFAARAVFCVYQKIASRPFTWVKTNCDRDCRGRSRTRSTAGPRRRQTQNRRLVDDVCVFWPWLFEAVAVDARGRRPRRPRLQYQAVLERQPDEIGQLAVFLWITRYDEAPAGG